MIHNNALDRPRHLIFLRRTIEDRWYSELSDGGTTWRSRKGSIRTCIAAARRKLAGVKADTIRLKVAEGTRVGRAELLTLIELNPAPEAIGEEEEEPIFGGSYHLDLAYCDLSEINLDANSIAHEAEAFKARTGRTAPWFAPAQGGVALDLMFLKGASLWHAKLRGAVMWGSDLTETNLAGADLYGAQLTEATLVRAFLGEADLRREAGGARREVGDLPRPRVAGDNGRKGCLDR